VNFLYVELQHGLTFCSLAKHADDCEEKYHRRFLVARRALELCREYLWPVKLKPHEMEELTAQVELLSFELLNLDVERTSIEGV
jgi:hypothetical protein